MNDDQIPTWLGGSNDKSLGDDPGPWQDYEIVDGHKRGDIVGIRKKGDGLNGRVFTPHDVEALPNLLLEDPQKVVELVKKNRPPPPAFKPQKQQI